MSQSAISRTALTNVSVNKLALRLAGLAVSMEGRYVRVAMYRSRVLSDWIFCQLSFVQRSSELVLHCKGCLRLV